MKTSSGKYLNEQALADLWCEEFSGGDGCICGSCILCGHSGGVDTRGKVFTRAGAESGGLAWCICPNGMAGRKSGQPLRERKEGR